MLFCGFQSQRTLKVSHDAAMAKVDELSAQLKDERLKSLDLEKQLQSSTISKIKMEQVTATPRYIHYTVVASHLFRRWLSVASPSSYDSQLRSINIPSVLIPLCPNNCWKSIHDQTNLWLKIRHKLLIQDHQFRTVWPVDGYSAVALLWYNWIWSLWHHLIMIFIVWSCLLLLLICSDLWCR